MTVETADAATGVHALRIGRAVVLAATAVLLALFVAGLVLWATRAGEVLPLWVAPDSAWTAGRLRGVLAGWGVPVGWYTGYFILLELLLVAVSVVAAWFVLRGALSWFRLYLVFVLVLFATTGGGVPLVVGELYPAVADSLELAQGVAWIALFPLAYVFPDGHFVPRWSRWLVVGWALWLATVVALDSTGEGAIAAVPLLLLFGSCVVAQVYRYARVSGPVERLQIRWVLCAVALRFGYNVALVATPLGAAQDEVTPRGLALYAGLMAVSYTVAAALPAAIAVAIVRHRLFDIDVVISRTLVYAVLTAFVIGTYALVVGGVGALWRGGGLATISTAARPTTCRGGSASSRAIHAGGRACPAARWRRHPRQATAAMASISAPSSTRTTASQVGGCPLVRGGAVRASAVNASSTSNDTAIQATSKMPALRSPSAPTSSRITAATGSGDINSPVTYGSIAARASHTRGPRSPSGPGR